MVDFYNNNNHTLSDYLFYALVVLVAAAIFAYLILDFKIHLQNQIIAQLGHNASVPISLDQQTYKQKIMDYKKKIDDFAVLLDNHKSALNVLNFVEENTIANVWFYNFDMRDSSESVRLSGQSANMDALSAQVGALEKNQDYVRGINVLNSQVSPDGKVTFTMDISFNPKIFDYQLPLAVNANSSGSNQ